MKPTTEKGGQRPPQKILILSRRPTIDDQRLTFISPASSLPRCSTSDKGCPTPGFLPGWCASGFRFFGGPTGRCGLPDSAILRGPCALPGGWWWGLRGSPLAEYPQAHRLPRGPACLPCRGSVSTHVLEKCTH